MAASACRQNEKKDIIENYFYLETIRRKGVAETIQYLPYYK